MTFCFNISLVLLDKESSRDFYELSCLFDDCSLSEFIEDNSYASYIYFIKENNKTIGFVYLMRYRGSDIYNVEYGIISSKLNNNYVYTVLTLIRDKIKGTETSSEIKDLTIVSSFDKCNKYNSIANLFGDIIYSSDFYNYYEVNPNCEDLSTERDKVLMFLKNNKTF